LTFSEKNLRRSFTGLIQASPIRREKLAMKSVEPRRQTVKDVAGRMREHLVSLRRQRPRAGVVKMADFRGQRQSRPNDLSS
jgi:hypothetical protein